MGVLTATLGALVILRIIEKFSNTSSRCYPAQKSSVCLAMKNCYRNVYWEVRFIEQPQRMDQACATGATGRLWGRTAFCYSMGFWLAISVSGEISQACHLR